MLKLAIFARDALSWDVGFENRVLVAFDFKNSYWTAFCGERQPSRYAADLQLHLGRLNYDPFEDIEVMKCSCNDVRQVFLS